MAVCAGINPTSNPEPINMSAKTLLLNLHFDSQTSYHHSARYPKQNSNPQTPVANAIPNIPAIIVKKIASVNICVLMKPYWQLEAPYFFVRSFTTISIILEIPITPKAIPKYPRNKQ